MTALETWVLLNQLEAAVGENLDRHLASAEAWMPHEYVPWSEGRNFAGLGGEPWSIEQSKLSPIARTALEVNLLTEDNLPSYHAELRRTFGREGAWGVWVNQWTAEEGRHASCIRDYLLVTRGVDPEQLEHARMVIRVTMLSSISNAKWAELLDVPLDVSTVSTIVWPARSTRVTSIRTSGPVNSRSFQARISS